MSLHQLSSDVDRLSKRLNDSAIDQGTKQVLRLEMLPLIKQLIGECIEIDGAVSELVDQQESFLEDELSQQIAGTIDASLALIGHLVQRIPEEKLEEEIDIMGAKMKLSGLIDGYRQSASAVRTSVLEVSGLVEVDDDDGDDNAGEKENENG